jgi:replicative DNA helicase
MTDSFAVTEDFQAKLLAFMLHNQEFCNIAAEALAPEQYTNKALRWFHDHITTKPLTPILLQEEMIGAAKNKEIKGDDIDKYVGLYNIIKQEPFPAEKDYLRDKLGLFIRTQAVKRAAIESLNLMEEERWGEIGELMVQATQAGVSLSDLGKNYFSRLKERVTERSNRKASRRIPTGIPELDQYTYGGIKNTQTGLIIGGTGRGKSIFLQWLARIAILLGKKVVYLTMELSEEEIEDRFDSMFAKVRPHELNEYQKNVLDEVGKIATMFGDSLIIKHFPMDSATVGTFKAFILQLSNIGIMPDLIIVDYIDLIKPHRHYNNKVDEQDAVVKAVVGMGQSLDVSIWTATQLNRSGLGMDTPDETTQAGYIGRQFIAAIVLFMAQTRAESEDECMRLLITKNRNGYKDRVIKLDTEYSYMTFYREQPEVQDDNGGGGVSSSEGTSQEKQQTSTPVEEKRDLQLLLEQSEATSAVTQEQLDGESNLPEVCSRIESESGDNTEGSDSVPEMSSD